MTTQQIQDRMTFIVEKSDGCWHDCVDDNGGCCYSQVQNKIKCFKCGEFVSIPENPTPTLDWLFEKAGELWPRKVGSITFHYGGKECLLMIEDHPHTGTDIATFKGRDNTPQLALLSALCKALGYESEEV